MGYMRTATVYINEGHPLFQYADNLTALTNNLSNTARFRQRQVLSAVSKEEADWTTNEREVMEEIRKTVPLIKKASMPTKGKHFLGYMFLEGILRVNHNPDFYAEGLPRQTAQHVLKVAVKDMKGFYKAIKEYNKNPDRFTGEPKLPGYKRKGGHSTALVTNQDCTIKTCDGKWYAYFPFAKDKPVCLGCPIPDARLKQACITPDNGRYKLSFQFEVDADIPEIPEDIRPERICAIDFGVDNLMSVTNNCGLPSLIYKGGVAKSVNQKYNKTIAALVSEQTLRTGEKFVPDAAYYAATNRRNDQISDFMRKCAKHFVAWCIENRIDTVVMGINKYWKQASAKETTRTSCSSRLTGCGTSSAISAYGKASSVWIRRKAIPQKQAFRTGILSLYTVMRKENPPSPDSGDLYITRECTKRMASAGFIQQNPAISSTPT